jgi:hypothetical protein
MLLEGQVGASASVVDRVSPRQFWFALAFKTAANARGDHKMKGIFLLIVSLLVFSLVVAAQDQRSRDLYVRYEPGSTSGGQPGAKVTVALSRKGVVQMVSPETVFRSGDRVRFHLALNFDGYLVVLNKGTSGRINRLYPYIGAPDPVQASAQLVVPGKEAWFVFDKTPGTEEVTFVMSKEPIEELEGLAGGGPTGQGRGLAPGSAPGGDEQKSLAALSNRAQQQSRDLHLEINDNAAYGVTTEQELSGLVKFTVFLKHEK